MDPATAFVALQAGQSLAKGMAGNAQAMDDSARAESAARLSDTQALQRDTIARQDLQSLLGSIRAARGASGVSAFSPNALNLEREATKQSDRTRRMGLADDRQRAANYRSQAAGARRRGRMSLITGVIGAGIPIAQEYAR